MCAGFRLSGAVPLNRLTSIEAGHEAMDWDALYKSIDISKDQHVSPAWNGGWGVRRTGTKKYYRVYRTKAEAFRHATEIARRKRVRLIIHDQSGMLQEWRDFAEGPRARWHRVFER